MLQPCERQEAWSTVSSPNPETLDVRELIPGRKRSCWARAAGLSVNSERRTLTARTAKALASAAHVPESWVPAIPHAAKALSQRLRQSGEVEVSTLVRDLRRMVQFATVFPEIEIVAALRVRSRLVVFGSPRLPLTS